MKQSIKTLVSEHILNMPLKQKFLGISVLNILMIAISALIGIELTTISNQKLLYKTIAGSLSYSATDISNKLNNVETMSGMILADSSVQDALAVVKDSHEPIERTNAYQVLNASVPDYFQTFKKNNIAYINLYNDSFITYTNKPRSDETPESIQQSIVTKAEELEGAAYWDTGYSNTYGLFLARNIRRIYRTQLDSLGTMLISINMENLVTSSTLFSSQYEDAAYLLFDEKVPVYHSKNLTEEQTLQIQNSNIEDYKVIHLGSDDYFAVKGTIPTYDWDYICLVSYDSIASTIAISKGICIGIILLMILISFLLSRKLITSVTGHMITLVEKIRAFGLDETKTLDVGYNYTNRNDEIGILHRQFDQMADEIRNLIQVNYVNELLTKEAQLKALENQINPHFLYNTLESINWRAKAIGEKDISSMVESLGTLLRITLSKENRHSTLKKELDLVQCYMAIQQIRFEERLVYKILIKPEFFNANIPLLTIQPLVENAIYYGLEESTETCCITIMADCKDNCLFIYVKNDGSQFEENLLEKLTTQQIQPRGLGIGLLNIDKRLKLKYGESYGLSLYNEEEQAVACIVIPYFTEEHMEV